MNAKEKAQEYFDLYCNYLFGGRQGTLNPLLGALSADPSECTIRTTAFYEEIGGGPAGYDDDGNAYGWTGGRDDVASGPTRVYNLQWPGGLRCGMRGQAPADAKAAAISTALRDLRDTIGWHSSPPSAWLPQSDDWVAEFQAHFQALCIDYAVAAGTPRDLLE